MMNEQISTISHEQALKNASKDEYDEKYNDYLNDVIFLVRDPTGIRNPMGIMDEKSSNELKKNIMEKSFKSSTQEEDYFTIAYDKISKVLPTNTNIEKKYKKNTKVEINISKVNDLDSVKDEWIPGVIVDLFGDNNNIIYTVRIDDSVDITKYKNIDISNKIISVENKNLIHFPDWRDCVTKCYTICHDYVKNEVESTAYMLRTLTASVLGNTLKYKICFSMNIDVLNFESLIVGKWKDDQKNFQIEICRIGEDGNIILSENNETKPANGRFILGAGPSASGKTYNAGLIIEMMKMVDPSFPTFFMTIDGGTYREKSVIYQTIIDAVKNKNQYPGLTNLMSASILDKFRGVQSIFETDSIKKVINDYLLEQKKREKFVVSLYVPDTLTYCGLVNVDCIPKLKIYIDITGDDNNWIGLMIYQHKTGGDGCPFKSGYKCVGCTESGKTREKTEGKKYSSAAWKMSYDHGLETIKEAPNYRIVFHNGGKLDAKSIFEDLSVKKISYGTNEHITQFFNEKKIEYIGGELTKDVKCYTYLLKGCKIQESEQPLQDVVRIDKEFVTKYNNKYIAIPKKLIDIPKSEDFDNMDDETVALLLMIQKFIDSGFFVLSQMDETEPDYNYYKINMNIFDYYKDYKDYEDFESLLESDEIKIYEKETDSKTETKPSAFGVWNFSSMPSVSMFSGDKSKIDEGVIQTKPEKIDKVIKDNPELKDQVNHADVLVVNDNNMSQKIKNKIGKDSNIKISEKTDEKTGQSITIVNVTGDKTPFMEWFTKTIGESKQSLSGVFINKKFVEAQGEPQSESQDKTSVQAENVPVMTTEEIVNNSSSKKRYIGIPKTLDNSNENEELKKHKKDTLNDLIDNEIITQINVNGKLLNNVNGYDEELYDYYELDVDELIKSRVEFAIRMAKLELTSAFETLAINNTLYIYENQPETNSTIVDAATNESTGSLVKNISNNISNTIWTALRGKEQVKPEEKPEEQKGDKSNDKSPNCNKNKTAKKSAQGNTGNNTKSNNRSQRSSDRLKDKKSTN